MRVKNYWTLQWMRHDFGLLSEDIIAPINLRSRLAHALRGHPRTLRAARVCCQRTGASARHVLESRHDE